MSRSLRVDPKYIQKVNLALKRNGYPSQRKFAEDIVPSLSTVKNFLKGKPVDYENFREICEKLGLDWQVITYIDVDVEADEEVAKPHQESVEIDASSIEERIFKATNQLDHERPMFSRMSAIQALGKIAADPRYHWDIMEILAAFVRNAPATKQEEGIPDDIQAALTLIGGRDTKKDSKNRYLNLRQTNLTRVDLSQAHLEHIDFTRANLSRANLSLAILKGAILKEANLEGVNLDGADLEEANLFQTVLRKARFRGANLEKAILMETDLSWARLERTNLRRVYLNKANLKGADLSGVNLSESHLHEANLEGVKLATQKSINCSAEVNMEGAVLRGANLKGVNLCEANLRQVDLSGANLKGANFSRVQNLDLGQLKLAHGDSTTILPLNVERPEHWR